MAAGIKTKVKSVLRAVMLHNRNKKIYLQYKPFCEKHKDDWEPLSSEELSKGYGKDRYTYTMLKNFGSDGQRDLSQYVTTAQYKSDFLPRLNRLDHTITGNAFHSLLVDKNYFPLLFPEFIHPHAVVRKMQGVLYDENYRPIDEETALRLMSAYDALVFKISRDSSQGRGVKRVEKTDYQRMLTEYGNNFLVQEIIKQHECFSYFNESSVNVVRILSLCWRGTVYILCAKLKVGAPGAFIDLGVTDMNPVEVGINEDGTFDNRAFEAEFDFKVYRTVFGKKIQGCVPGFDKMKDLVKQAHIRFPDYGILGWDLTVDKNGRIVFIEVNSRGPAIDDSQCICGPFFNKLSKDGHPLKEQILSEPLDLNGLKAF